MMPHNTLEHKQTVSGSAGRGRRRRRRAAGRIAGLLVLLLGSACAPSLATRPGPAEMGAREGLIRRLYLDGYLRGNLAVIDSVYAPEYLRHDSGESATGSLAQQHGLATALRQAFPDLQVRVDFVVSGGDTVAARWTMWGTATGPGPWGPPTGKAFRFSGINVYRFEDGRVVELWNHRDDLHWFRQMGLLPPAPADQPSTAATARDSSVTVSGVHLHYRDWGGDGEPVILLAGLANTARIYDGFAPELARDFRVLALTRRAHGRSELVEAGFDLDTLVSDIRGFMDALGIRRAHLVGHSLAGAELTRFAARFPERVDKLVYLDAAYDRSTQAEALAADPLERQGPTAADRASADAYLGYVQRTRLDLARYWTAPVVADVRENLAIQTDGSVRWATPGTAYGQMIAGASLAPPEYERVNAPSLAIYSVEDEGYWLPEDASPDLRAAFDRFQEEGLGRWRQQSIEQFRSGMRNGQVVEMDAGHHMFLHRPGEVLQLVRDFLGRR